MYFDLSPYVLDLFIKNVQIGKDLDTSKYSLGSLVTSHFMAG